MGRLKVISDGTVSGTRIIDEETGKEIVNVRRIKLSYDANDNAIFLTLYAQDVPFEFDSDTQKDIQLLIPPQNTRQLTG